ncbi:MAG: hypothetical protein K5648_00050 [Erysipelotrichaceae bacterium]|nr:hypothetical protein [Erysipelotrichaceae bacterium]
MKKDLMIFLFLSILLLSSCSSSSNTEASDMKLQRYEGQIEVNDKNKDVDVLNGMNLFDGYDVKTLKESYGWIGLDQVKLLKLDQSSGIAINKNGRKLKIDLQNGSLFFCVEEPLDEEEELSFETENMSLSIRGTTGIVKTGPIRSEAMLIEGEAKITVANGQQVSLTSGEKAVIVKDQEGKVSVTVEKIALGGDVPDYALEEMRDNDAVKTKIEEQGVFADYMNEEEKEALLNRFFGTWRGRNHIRYGDRENDYTWIISQGGGPSPGFWIRLSDESREANRTMYVGQDEDNPIIPEEPALPFVAIKALDENTIENGAAGRIMTLSDNGSTLTISGEGVSVTWTRIN